MATNIPASQIMNRFERNISRAKRKARLWAYDRIESLVKRLQKIKIKSINVSNDIYTIDGDRVDAILYGQNHNFPLTLAAMYCCNVVDFSLAGCPKKDAELFEEIANITQYCAKNNILFDIKF